MIRFLADENFNNDIVRGLVRRVSGVDIVRVQDIGLQGEVDRVVLERAADEGRIVLTHDLSTLIALAYERIEAGDQVPGLLAAPQSAPVKRVIEDLVLIVECSTAEDWQNRVSYLPLS